MSFRTIWVTWQRVSINFACVALAFVFLCPASAANIALSPEAAKSLNQTYSGDPDAAIATAKLIQQSQPDSPVGYLVEAEAEWWKTYCSACEVKWGMLDAWKRPKNEADNAYFALADKAIDHARRKIAVSDTAEMHVYLGLGLALKARLYALRDEKRNVAHVGVAARSEFLRALQLDPDMADATAGVGLYNYYVDTLSAVAKMLRFFMGIPGGNKEEGIRQMRIGVERGVFFSVDSRFYLARNLRTFDSRYSDALAVAEPLASRYPHNPVFLLLMGNLHAELGHNLKAAEYFHSAQNSGTQDSTCAARAREVATAFLGSLSTH